MHHLSQLCHVLQSSILHYINGPSIDIKKQEEENIRASNEKEKIKIEKGENIESRNTHRQGPARQKKSIALVSWGGLFTCNEKKCAYQQCQNCGVLKFFSSANLCNAERNANFVVKVRKYENIPGRSRGMQLEIVEVEMNGEELFEHLIKCALAAIPHEWNIRWNTHMRQLCINTYQDGCLNLMTDFSAVLDHDVQDRMNTVTPCRSNLCVVLASYSPRYIVLGEIRKRIQENDVWHCWSAQGGVLDTNYYYHSVVVRHLMQHYAHLNITRLNVFTNGCGEQYESRRNAYFVADLAREYGMTVTHNFAPTASFKTMVDGQGDLVKSTYRNLEKSEVEGTRCPTTYDLFELFTSRYPLTPTPFPDATRRLMSITGRMHRYLVDKVDATNVMELRAQLRNDVIITDYMNERWDAPILRGIKGIFCLIGTGAYSDLNLSSREHASFCQHCTSGTFQDCTHQSTTGALRNEVALRLPYKEANPRKVPTVGDILKKINYFKERFSAGMNAQIIMAMMVEHNQENQEPFKMVMVTKSAKQLKNDYIFECTIDGSTNKITIEKGIWCITVRCMEKTAESNTEYIIPARTKEIKVAIENVYFPDNWNEVGHEFNISFTVRSEEIMGQTLNYYSISQISLDALQLDSNVEL